MILMRVKYYLKAQKMVSLQQIARHFDMTPRAIEPMLDFWTNKGLIRQCQQGCKSCFACSQSNRYYQLTAL
jgi:DeoR/GlpR family transcriptional regulator of sugar metabolism